MKKLLITGASGFLGWNLCRAAVGDWAVTGVYRAHAVAQAGIDVMQAELTEPGGVERLLDETRPEAVIHAAALASPNDCERNPEGAFRINVEATERLAQGCAMRGVPLVFISTDLVFDGVHAPYAEDAPVGPVNAYGRQKVEAERRVLAIHPQALICRMPLMFGDPGPHAASFIQGNLKAFSEGKPQPCFVDEFRTPVGGCVAARGILMALRREVRGVLHLGGKERVSRYDFGLLLADVFGYSSALVRLARQKDIPIAAPRPPDVSLDSSMAFSLGYNPGPLRQQLEELSPRA